MKYVQCISQGQLQVHRPAAGDSCDGGISVLYNCLSWYKFVNTHLYHSRQLYNIHIWDHIVFLPPDRVDFPACTPCSHLKLVLNSTTVD